MFPKGDCWFFLLLFTRSDASRWSCVHVPSLLSPKIILAAKSFLLFTYTVSLSFFLSSLKKTCFIYDETSVKSRGDIDFGNIKIVLSMDFDDPIDQKIIPQQQ